MTDKADVHFHLHRRMESSIYGGEHIMNGRDLPTLPAFTDAVRSKNQRRKHSAIVYILPVS